MKRNIENESNSAIVKNLNWNQLYRWNYSVLDHNGNEIFKGKEFEFHINGCKNFDDENYKVDLINSVENNVWGMVFLDHANVSIDRKGQLSWYLPENDSWAEKSNEIRDLRMTSNGTLTFMLEGNGIYETDLAGNILWKKRSPLLDTIFSKRYFHHEFFKKDDHYFVLVHENVKRFYAGDTAEQVVPFDNIHEYDGQGKLVWEWRSEDYLIDEEFIALRGDRKMTPAQGHMNSAFLSPDGKYVYAGYRNISRVIKIRKKNGKVVNSYGKKIIDGRAEIGHDWFRRQHNATLLPGGKILLFNNDSVIDPSKSSSLVIFDENAQTEENGLLWRFDLKFDTLSDARCTATGSAEMLPNGNILAGLGTVNRIIEVTPDKKVVFDAFILKKSSVEKGKIEPFPMYRVHYTPTLWPVAYGTSISRDETISFNITNQGSIPDQYTLTIIDEKAGVIYSKKSKKPVPPGEKTVFETKLTNLRGRTIRVTPASNPAFATKWNY